MRILIVIDDFHNKSNGMCISTQRFANEFKKRGHEVRVISCPINGKVDYPVSQMYVPFFNRIIKREGYHLAWPNGKALKQALTWANVVAIETPFPLGWRAQRLAKKANIPTYGTFHIFPQNLTQNIHLNYPFFNDLVMYVFRELSYKKCIAIQCPTEKVKDHLIKYNFQNELYVISNGISKEFIENPHKPNPGHPFTILCIGRFSNEKKQITLFNAIKKSKYRDKIKVIFAGKGPLKSKYQKLADTMPKRPILKFYTPQQLRRVMVRADLVVHCADIEVEGMAPMEAFAAGCVPVIASSPLSSTDTYALTEMNRFPAEDSDILAKRIDYWYDHPSKLKEMRKKYREFSKTLTVSKSADKALEMIKEISADEP
ncbi:glycosyltransferase [Lactobacillus agrestimuris]|uniref:glycosyltransferase n=1 Tax=Lactobacillus agrestimuris TaxID=2941328 RepID=UPI0020439130|nr:glycosyltransferase [Lactobacillus agrestimuris]